MEASFFKRAADMLSNALEHFGREEERFIERERFDEVEDGVDGTESAVGEDDLLELDILVGEEFVGDGTKSKIVYALVYS